MTTCCDFRKPWRLGKDRLPGLGEGAVNRWSTGVFRAVATLHGAVTMETLHVLV